MKLIINGDISRYYVQNLCLIFFPGSTFSPGEEVTEETPVVTVNMEEREEGVYAFSSIKIGEQQACSEDFEKYRKGFTEERIKKIAVGKAVFSAGESFFGYTPSWGILTGIRPAKISRQLLNDGNDAPQIRKILRNEYFLNPKKAALLTSITLSEAKIIDEIGEKTCSLYVSIPFCPTRCAYCSFVSFATKRLLSMVPEYMERLIRDIDRVCDIINRNGLRLTTVYIGGGTPTTLNEEQLVMLLETISRKVDISSLREFSIEAGRPDTITGEKLHIIKDYGVNRISINPQTLNDAVLRGIGRCHTVEDFYRAFELARESGIQHINTDLIAGLPGDTYRSFSKTVDQIIKLGPDNITVHTFSVKKAADIVHSGAGVYQPNAGDAQKSVDYSQLKLRNNGYLPYYLYRQRNTVGNLENVGYALPECEGLYNIYIMEELHHIFAVGAGAVTKLVDNKKPTIERIFMPKYPYEYLSKDCERQFAESYEMKVAEFLSKMD